VLVLVLVLELGRDLAPNSWTDVNCLCPEGTNDRSQTIHCLVSMGKREPSRRESEMVCKLFLGRIFHRGGQGRTAPAKSSEIEIRVVGLTGFPAAEQDADPFVG
jgi:hypothetical protein